MCVCVVCVCVCGVRVCGTCACVLLYKPVSLITTSVASLADDYATTQLYKVKKMT